MAFMRHGFASYFLPEGFACLTVQAKHHELIGFVWRFRIHTPALAAAVSRRGIRRGCGSRLGGLPFGFFAGRNGRQNEDSITPNNRGGIAAAGNFNLPFDMLSLA